MKPTLTLLTALLLAPLAAAQHYVAYLRQSQQGNAAQYSYNRLKAWGVVK